MTTPAIQFSGLSSGLDTKSIISALMQAEQAPLTRLQTAVTTLNARKSAYTDLGTSLSDFLSKLQAFTLLSAGSARSATVADATKLSAQAGSSAVPGTYRISVDRLASATRATSTAAIGAAVTDPSASLSSLPLPGTVTSGNISVIVGGTIRNVAVDANGSLQSVLDGIAGAIAGQLGPGAQVTGSVVANKVQFAVTGAPDGTEVRFGAAGDTSNALGILGLSGQVASVGASSTISGSSLLGVVRTTSALDSAGLSGLTSTTNGVLTINGVDIAYNTTTESLNAILTKINDSNAGVIASVDRTNDRVVLTRKTAGAGAINIVDKVTSGVDGNGNPIVTTGNLAAALNLAPGTTNAQVIGQTAQVTVDNRTVVSDTNTVTNAIDGVSLNLLDLTSGATTLTVSVNTDSIKSALTDLVTSYNTLADKVDAYTKHVTGAPDATLENDSTVRDLAMSLRSTLLSVSSTITSGSYTSLSAIGVNSGDVGSKAGTTNHLQVDATKLTAALTADPGAVSKLLSSAGGVLQPVIDRVKALADPGGVLDDQEQSIDDQLAQNSKDQARVQEQIDLKQAALEAKFAALEATLAQLNTTQGSVTSQASQWGKSS